MPCDLLRRLAKGLIRRALKHTPKVPNSGPTARTPPLILIYGHTLITLSSLPYLSRRLD